MGIETAVGSAGKIPDTRQFVDRIERDVFNVCETFVSADAQRSLHWIGIEGLGGAE